VHSRAGIHDGPFPSKGGPPWTRRTAVLPQTHVSKLSGVRIPIGPCLVALALAACASPADQPSLSPESSASPPPPTESETATPTTDPSATPATPSAEEPAVELGVTAVTTADRIRVREAPSDNSAQVNELEAGTRVVVISEPVADASDPALEWWYVMPSEGPCGAACGIDKRPGWMTTGPERSWLRAEAPDCPDGSSFTADTWDENATINGLLPTNALVQCFGNAPIVFEGVIDYFCCRGITLGVTEPAWLAGDYSMPGVARLFSPTTGFTWGPDLRVDPASGVTLGERGTVARVTGHFDDPAAQSCVTTIDPGVLELNPEYRWTMDPPLAIWACRNGFAVDDVEVLDVIPLPTQQPQG
jgi:hypothetical protein